MTTKQNDAVAMTEEQLDAVVGGALGDIKGMGGVVKIVKEVVQDGVLRLDKSSPKSRFRGCLPLRRC
jgi:hypothetical protein